MKSYILKSKVILFISISLLSAVSRGLILENSSYPFPIQSAELSTIASVAPYEMKMKMQKLNIELYPARSNIYLLENRHQIEINFLKQNHQAPFIFIIPGVGGTGKGTVIKVLMEQLYELGYHVVALPNPLSWTFVLGASQRGIAGYLNWDILDLYSLMKKTAQTLNLPVSDYNILGYSLGAGLLPKLSELDEDQKAFSFKKILLLNPPVNFDHGVKTLDAYYHLGDLWTDEQKDMLMGYLLSFGEKLMNNKNLSAAEVLKEIQITEKQQRYLIGNSYRESLAEIIYTTELLLNQKFLSSNISWGYRSLRFEEAKSFSFTTYLEKIVLPIAQKDSVPNLKFNELVNGYNLRKFKKKFQNDKRFYLFHNANDFLLEEGDVAFLEGSFLDRAIIFPLGGHCGNFSFSINKKFLKSILEGPKEYPPSQGE